LWFIFFLLLLSPPSVTPRFSESLSVNHLSFKLRFSGLSFNSPRSKLRRLCRKPGVFRNEIQVLLSKFAGLILIPSLFFSLKLARGLFLIPRSLILGTEEVVYLKSPSSFLCRKGFCFILFLC